MFRSIRSILAVTILGAAAAGAQQQSPNVSIRAFLFDPLKPKADLYVPDAREAIVKLDLVQEGFSKPVPVKTVNGSLVLYNKATVDRANPGGAVAASVPVPEGAKRLMVVIVPNKKPEPGKAYRLILIDDNHGAFPGGESRILSLLPADTAVEAGEHKLKLASNSVTKVPPVKKVNEFNIAQTNFYYMDHGRWMPFTERQLQYLDTMRRVFIADLMPTTTQPFVTTVADGPPAPPDPVK